MASVTKRGQLVSFSDTAVDDMLVGQPVINATLRSEDGTLFNVRIPMGARFKIGWKLVDALGLQNRVLGDDILAIDEAAVTGQGRLNAHSPYDRIEANRTYHLLDLRIRPAIGDSVTVSWDYERSDCHIEAFAPDRTPMPETLPVEGSRAFHFSDIADSLNGE